MTGGTQLCFSFRWKTVIVLSFTNIPCLKLFDSKLIYLKYDPKRFRADWDVFFNCDIISFFLLASETEKEKKKKYSNNCLTNTSHILQPKCNANEICLCPQAQSCNSCNTVRQSVLVKSTKYLLIS